MNSDTDDRLKDILSDKISGSTELLCKINLYFKENNSSSQDLKRIINIIQNQFGPFQNIQHYLTDLKSLLLSNKLSEKYFENFELKSGSLFDKIFSNALPYLRDKKSILTISNSRTVFEILLRYSKIQKNKIIICESRPKLEGRETAKNFSKEGINVELITEAMAPGYMADCDCVITGADMILSNNNVVNKVGSLELAILAGYFGKPYYVVADRSKFTRRKSFAQKQESSEQVWKNSPKNVLIENKYFEEIPYKLITRIITDKKARH